MALEEKEPLLWKNLQELEGVPYKIQLLQSRLFVIKQDLDRVFSSLTCLKTPVKEQHGNGVFQAELRQLQIKKDQLFVMKMKGFMM